MISVLKLFKKNSSSCAILYTLFRIFCYIANSLTNDVLFILCLDNPSLMLIYNCIISRLIPTSVIEMFAYSEDKETYTILSNIRTKSRLY